MKKIFILLVAAALFVVLSIMGVLPGPSYSKNEIKDNVSIFKVPLICDAAPHIGCGSESKPILLELEKDPLVESAWLSRSGTEMAIVWKEDVKPEDKTARIKAISEKYQVPFEEITGEDGTKSKEGFASGIGWYKGTDVDKLSEEEAWVIADKVALEVKAKVELSADKEEKLKSDVAGICKTIFFAVGTENEHCDGKQLVDDFYNKAGGYLNKNEMAALKSVVDKMVKVIETGDEEKKNEKDCREKDCCKEKK